MDKSGEGKSYCYFVSFIAVTESGSGFGNCVLSRDTPIATEDDIDGVRLDIQEELDANDATIISFVLLKQPADDTDVDSLRNQLVTAQHLEADLRARIERQQELLTRMDEAEQRAKESERLTEENQRLQAELGTVSNIRADLSREVEAGIILNARKPLEADNERLQAALEAANDLILDAYDYEYCPACAVRMDQIHADNCKWVAAKLAVEDALLSEKGGQQ